MIYAISYENKMCLGHEGKGASGEPCQDTSQGLKASGVVDGKGKDAKANHSPKKAPITPKIDVVMDHKH